MEQVDYMMTDRHLAFSRRGCALQLGRFEAALDAFTSRMISEGRHSSRNRASSKSQSDIRSATKHEIRALICDLSPMVPEGASSLDRLPGLSVRTCAGRAGKRAYSCRKISMRTQDLP